MTPAQIAADIERGIVLRREIKERQAELKLIEKRLEQAGLAGDQVPLQEEDREGRQFIARSSDHVLPVIFESDQIVASFKPDGDLHHQIAAAAGDHLAAFYADVRSFERVPKDGQAFRKLARELLGTAAPAFIAACLQRDKAGIPKSRTVIGWDNVRDATAVPA